VNTAAAIATDEKRMIDPPAIKSRQA